MAKFKKGDRVVFIADNKCDVFPPKFTHGTVDGYEVYGAGYPFVWWDVRPFGFPDTRTACAENYMVLETEYNSTIIPSRSIYITSDGMTTHAVLKEDGKVVKRAEAVCNPSDKYDFNRGAGIAYMRLMGSVTVYDDSDIVPFKTMFLPFKRISTTNYKVGDKVRVVTDPHVGRHCYDKGDVLELAEKNGAGWLTRRKDGARQLLTEYDFEPYTEPAKTEPPAFSWDEFKAGKIAVHCDTKEKRGAFRRECYKQNISWVGGESALESYELWPDENSAFRFDCGRGGFVHSDTETCKKKGYEIIDYPFYREVKRPAKVGEWVKIVAPEQAIGYCAGDFFKMIKPMSSNGGGYVIDASGERNYVYAREYVVLEGYKPKEE